MANKIDVKIKKLESDAIVPQYQTDGSAGFDIHAYVDEYTMGRVLDGPLSVVLPGQTIVIRTGLSFEIPEGFELQIRPRSGLAKKHGITVANSPGTLDSDYRGELMVMLTNHGNIAFDVKNGDRIAQGIIAPVYQANFIEAEELEETERGAGGFGSTGV